MFTPIKKKIKGKWNHLLRRSSGPKIRGKYLFFEGNEENYIRNGAHELEESISLFHGKTNPIRHFSVNDLNNMKLERVPYFDNGFKCIYQGYWDGRVVLLAYAKECHNSLGDFIREIVVATQMATHNNSHKILGCFLETFDPAIVYEWVTPKTLHKCIITENDMDGRESVLEWKDRLRIAWEISHCVSYLHTAFPRPIIHRDIKLSNVFLDMDNSAQLSGYSFSISIPEGEEFVEDRVIGTMGYLDKEYMLNGEVRESIDVYSFGMLLIVLLTGKDATYITKEYQIWDCLENKCINYETIDPLITTNGVTTFEEFQIQATFHLALSCIGPREERPTMEEVAIQLKNMITRPESISPPDGRLQIRGKYLFFEGNEENYIRNGAHVLEESISLFHGKANPIRHFSVNELNNMKVERVPYFDESFKRGYKGYWDERVVLLVYAKECNNSLGDFIREIVVATQMATHNNSHKILGCCLETFDPAIVYEWVAPKTLHKCIITENDMDGRESVLEWKDRLRIAWEISHCVSYLHTAFPRPIIHRDIKLSNVFLDMDNSAQLSGYSLSISIPEGEEFVEDRVIGTVGYLDKEYMLNGEVRESIDVYSCGMLLLVLLTGKHVTYIIGLSEDNQIWDCLENNCKCINYEIIDPVITTNGVTTFEEFQIQATFHLALSCIGPREERPTMEEVAIQLKNMITRPESILPPDGRFQY